MGENTATWKTKRGSIEATKQLPGHRHRLTPHLLNRSHHPMSNWGAACQTRPSKPYIPPPWASSAQARKAKLFPTHQTDQAGVPRREHCPGWLCKKTGLLVLPGLNSAPQTQPYTPTLQKGVKKKNQPPSCLLCLLLGWLQRTWRSPCPASLGCVHTLPPGALGGVQRGLQRPRTSWVPEGKST